MNTTYINDKTFTELENFSENEIKKPPDNSPTEDDYDTDIEIKENHVSYDHSGKTSYIKQCYKEGVIPSGYFLRHLNGKKMVMRHHGLGLNGIKPICSSLMTNGTITSLDLTDNWLGDQSIPFIMAMMKENCFITELILANNNLTYKCSEMLATSLSHNLQISHLDLSQNSFDDRAVNFMADLIMNVDRLEFFNLSKNKFGAGCLLPLGKAISQAHRLQILDLSWNHITGQDMKHFCAGLSENSSIKVLRLGWNGLGSSLSMQEVGKMLKMNTTLEELDLTNNRITLEGAMLLGKGLAVNNTLKMLKIGQNPLQSSGCYAILQTILKNSNSSLVLLDFENLRVNQDFLELKSGISNELIIHTGSRIPVRPSSSIHPIKRLRTYFKKNKLSLLKYFQHFNDAQNMNLTKNDFRSCLQYFCKDTKFELTENEMDRLMDYLDKNQNGFIDYKYFIQETESDCSE